MSACLGSVAEKPQDRFKKSMTKVVLKIVSTVELF
jgi:hypothetical protein